MMDMEHPYDSTTTPMYDHDPGGNQ
jgi:hypothetical protein